MALAAGWVEEPVKVLGRERGDGYALEGQRPDLVAQLSGEGQQGG